MLSALPLVCAATAIICVRAILGFQFPVPWPDETGFVAPAFDFARTGSFFDPGMNPDRVVMWMPPGYMLVLAALFRVFGYSFSLARWFSTLCCLLSLGLCGVLIVRLTRGWARVAAACGVSVAFLSPFMLASANIARMDMLLATMLLLALVCIVHHRPYVAAALVASGMVVHFNAIYFVLPVLLTAAAAAWRRDLHWPSAGDWLALAAAALIVASYAIYALLNWAAFSADIAFQFAFKHAFAVDDPAHPAWLPLAGCALAAFAVWRCRGIDEAAACALFGAAFLVMAYNGHEIWYDYAQPLGFSLLALALLATPPAPLAAAPWQWPAGAVALALVALAATRITPSLRPLLPHRAMLHRSVVAPAEITKVRTFIATLQPGATVNFGWTGMELFFLDDLARAGARWTIIRHSVTQIWPLRTYDWRVRCDSSEWPASSFRFDIDYPRTGHDTGCDIIAVAAAKPRP